MRTTIPAPLGGVNFQSGIANVQMPEAVELFNWIARTACCESRGGTILREQISLTNDQPIRTLAPHPSGILTVGMDDRLYPYDTNTNSLGLYTDGFTIRAGTSRYSTNYSSSQTATTHRSITTADLRTTR